MAVAAVVLAASLTVVPGAGAAVTPQPGVWSMGPNGGGFTVSPDGKSVTSLELPRHACSVRFASPKVAIKDGKFSFGATVLEQQIAIELPPGVTRSAPATATIAFGGTFQSPTKAAGSWSISILRGCTLQPQPYNATWGGPSEQPQAAYEPQQVFAGIVGFGGAVRHRNRESIVLSYTLEARRPYAHWGELRTGGRTYSFPSAHYLCGDKAGSLVQMRSYRRPDGRPCSDQPHLNGGYFGPPSGGGGIEGGYGHESEHRVVIRDVDGKQAASPWVKARIDWNEPLQPGDRSTGVTARGRASIPIPASGCPLSATVVVAPAGCPIAPPSAGRLSRFYKCPAQVGPNGVQYGIPRYGGVMCAPWGTVPLLAASGSTSTGLEGVVEVSSTPGPRAAALPSGFETAQANTQPASVIASIIAVQGRAVVRRANGRIETGRPGTPLYLNDKISTDSGSLLALEFTIGGKVGLNKGSSIILTGSRSATEAPGQTVTLEVGGFWAQLGKQKGAFIIRTHNTTIGIRG